MSQGVSLGKHHATFAPGFDDPLYWRTLFWPAIYSRGLRAAFFRLPPSRLRMAFVARFFWRLILLLGSGQLGPIRQAIPGDAALEFFGLGTYRGPRGWDEALAEWAESFRGLSISMDEFINPPGDVVVCGIRVGGEGAESQTSVSARSYLVVTLTRGMATHAVLTNSREEALEAVGLSE